MVTHSFMGPGSAFIYAAGQLMDYGVHTWDIEQGTGSAHGISGEAADLLVPFMFVIWHTDQTGRRHEPVHHRHPGDRRHNAGGYGSRISDQGMRTSRRRG